MQTKEIKINKIKANPDNPREDYNGLKELAENILSNGLLVSIKVADWKGTYLLVDGERRLKACKLAKLKTIRSEVQKYDNELQMLKDLFCINLMRKNFKPLENAKLLKKIWIASGKPSERLLSSQMGFKNHESVREAFTLLKAPEEVRQAVKEKKLGQRSVTYLSKLPEKKQIQIAQKVRKKEKREGQIPIAERVDEELEIEASKKLKENFVEIEKRKYSVDDYIRNTISFLWNGVTFYKVIPRAVHFLTKDQMKKLLKEFKAIRDIYIEPAIEILEKETW